MTSDYLDLHIQWCKQRNLRPIYIASRRRVINQLARELGQAPENATEADFAEWYQGVTDRMVAEARACYLSHVQCYFRWLVREEFLSADPTVRLTRPRTRPTIPRPIDDDSLARAIQTATDRVRPWLLLAAYAGLRATEIAHLRAADVNLRTGMLIVSGKGGKERTVPIHPDVADALRPYMGQRGFLFRHWDRPGPPTAHNVSYALNHHLRRQGIVDTAHAARHWFITNIYRQTLDLRLAQELAGHSTPNTTAGYAKHSTDRAAEAVRQLRAVSGPDSA